MKAQLRSFLGFTRFFLVAWMILVPVALAAQTVVTGDVSGTVTDPSGAVVVGANVQLADPATGYSKSVVTGSAGSFRFAQLKPGVYTLKGSSTNFQPSTKNVAVQLGQVTNATLALGVNQVVESVQVTAESPLLQTENANITTTYNQMQVEQLPNPGGDITYYANTAPGIAMNTSGSGFGNFTAFGLPSTSNLFTENGNDENDAFLNLNNSGSSNLLLGKNEVQEVAVVTNGYTGQYGRQAGAVVNYTTKYGTNQFHGDATYDWNGRYLNANEFFNKQAGNPTPFANNNQWSADFGGPIIKNKTYFYADTEGLRYILPAAQNVFFPTTAFQTAVLNNIAATSPAQLPFYTQMMNLYKNAPSFAGALPFSSSPAAQAGDATGGCEDLAGTGGFGGSSPCLNFFHANGSNLNKEWLLTVRIDQNIGTKDVLFGRYKMDRGSQPTSTDLVDQNLFGTHSTQPTYEGQLNETHTFNSRMVNSFIASGTWYSTIFQRNSGEAAALAALPYSTVQFGSNPMSPLGGTDPNSPDFIFPQGRNVTQWQLTDDFSISKSRHEFKFGVNYRRSDITDFDNQVLLSGLLNFGSMTNFFNGVAIGQNGNSDFFQQNFTNNKEVPLAVYSLGLYAQDSWKAAKNLKFTLALRADINSNGVCQSNCYARLTDTFTSLNHDPTIPYNQAINANVHTAFPNLQGVAWQPRIGFTWNPRGGNTVIRGGAGMFSDLYAAVLLDNMIANAPEVNGFTVSPGSPTTVAPGPGGVAGIAGNSNSAFMNGFASGQTFGQISAATPFFVAPNFFATTNHLSNPVYGEWNLEIQQAFGPHDVLSVNYVGNHGWHLLVSNPGVNAFGFGPLPTAAPDPRFGNVNQLSSGAVSNFAGLATSYSHRFSHGVQGSISYTWSHALDEVSSLPVTPFSSAQTLATQINPFNLRSLNYASADSDVRHNLTASYVWNLPGKFNNRMMNEIAGGWQVAGTVFLRSPLPFSVIDLSAGQGVQNLNNGAFSGFVLGNFLGSGRPSACTSPTSPCLASAQFTAQGAETSFGNVPRNFFRGPNYFNSDFSVGKVLKVTEKANLRLGLNFYNIFNHPNFEAPVNDIGSPNFGQIQATAVEPTNPYGSYQQAGVSGRLIQIEGKIKF